MALFKSRTMTSKGWLGTGVRFTQLLVLLISLASCSAIVITLFPLANMLFEGSSLSLCNMGKKRKKKRCVPELHFSLPDLERSAFDWCKHKPDANRCKQMQTDSNRFKQMQQATDANPAGHFCPILETELNPNPGSPFPYT